jgi:hypothetical protein
MISAPEIVSIRKVITFSSPLPACQNRQAENAANTSGGTDHGVGAMARAMVLFSTGGKQKPVLLHAMYVTLIVMCV